MGAMLKVLNDYRNCAKLKILVSDWDMGYKETGKLSNSRGDALILFQNSGVFL